MNATSRKTTEPDEDSDEIARILRGSLESTVKGLSSFVGSLEQSGMLEAVPAYQKLYLLLSQQRLWSDRAGRKELEPLWRQVSDEAGKIYGIMSPLAEAMKRMSSVYELNSDQAQTTGRPRLPNPYVIYGFVTGLRTRAIPLAILMDNVKKRFAKLTKPDRRR